MYVFLGQVKSTRTKTRKLLEIKSDLRHSYFFEPPAKNDKKESGQWVIEVLGSQFQRVP